MDQSNGDAGALPSLELPRKRSHLERARDHLTEDVTEAWSDAVLIVSCFVTGLLDSAVFNVWSCFVSMQTGIYEVHIFS